MENFKTFKNYIFVFLICIIFIAVNGSEPVFAELESDSVATSTVVLSNEEKVKLEIEKKNQELLEINNQIAETRDQLESTQNQKQTLQGELNKINSNLKQLDLGVRLSQTSIEKLNLEIEATQYDIEDSEDQIENKKQGIVETLQKLQQRNGSNNFLMIILKNGSLAESVFEAQSLLDLENQLISDINTLRSLKEELGNNLNLAENKKSAKESEAKNLKYKKIITQETQKERQTLLVQTKNKETVYQQSLTELQKLQDQIASEVDKLESNLRLKIDKSFLPTARPGVLGIPIESPFRITQEYGYTKFALTGVYKNRAPHNGMDFGAQKGTEIYSSEKGKVIGVANQDLYCRKGAYGKFIAIEHENNLTTLYAHLSLWVVKEGDQVERGQLIGYSGDTGFATGPHLHYGVYASQTFHIDRAQLNCGPKMPYGGTLNPADYLEHQ